MKTISVALRGYFATPGRKGAACFEIVRTDGVVIRGTSYTADIVIDGDTYRHRSGGNPMDMEASAALDVDNTEITCHFDQITAADIKAGLYDGATESLFLVNPKDLTMGRYSQVTNGSIGTITVDRLTFTGDLFSRMQKLQQPFGGTITPTCPYVLGSSERLAIGLHDCTLNLAAFTVTGTLDSIVDQFTLRDAARTEAGPSGGIVISAISNATHCVLTLASPPTQQAGEAIMLSGILGMVRVNGVWTIESKSGSTITINLNTSNTGDFPAYLGSGLASPLTADAGYFGYGLCTITSGANAGISREVKSSAPGQWTLQDRFPFDLVGNETYSMIAGDDKTFTTCRVKFANQLNFGGFPFVPGQDSALQVGHPE